MGVNNFSSNAPTVMTKGREPGKLILPNEGPSFPADAITIAPLDTAFFNYFLITKLKLLF
jgi:hypothetical protein